jgi:hypothetical protein
VGEWVSGWSRWSGVGRRAGDRGDREPGSGSSVEERWAGKGLASYRLQVAGCRFQTVGGGWEWKWKAEVQGEGEGARDAWVVLPKGNQRWSCGGAGRAGRANAKASSSRWRQAQQQEGATVGLGQPEVATRVCGRAMYFQAQARYAMTVPSRPIWAGSSKASLNKK